MPKPKSSKLRLSEIGDGELRVIGTGKGIFEAIAGGYSAMTCRYRIMFGLGILAA